jgi:hypothetical protein
MVLLDLLDALEKVRLFMTCSRPPFPPPLADGFARIVLQMKELLDDNDAVTNEVAGQAYVENFALNVFSGADDEDRAGKATK